MAAIGGCQDAAKLDEAPMVTPRAIFPKGESPLATTGPTQPGKPQPEPKNTSGAEATATSSPSIPQVEPTRSPVGPVPTGTAQAAPTPSPAPFVVETNVAPFKHKDYGIPLTHASVSNPNAGCGMCHTQPLKQSCVACHQSPPIQLADKQSRVTVQFPHHSTSPGGSAPNMCQLCHTGSDSDVRVVTIPQMAHAYCRTCHPPLQHT